MEIPPFKQFSGRQFFSYLLFFSVLAWSCSYDDIGPPRNLTSYQVSYMMGANGAILPEPGKEPIVALEYDTDGRPSRRTGALIPAPFFTGFTHTFTDLLHDDVTHSGNKITVVKKDDFPELDVRQNWKELLMVDGSITRTIIKRWQDEKLDTIDFYYNGSTLWKTRQRTYRSSGDRFIYESSIEKYFTFSNGNLQRIEGMEYGRMVSAGPLYKTLETFSDYDHAPNPTSRLIIFDEVFYRALSKNNFRKYTYERKAIDGQLTSSSNQSWTFQYDEKGVPTFIR